MIVDIIQILQGTTVVFFEYPIYQTWAVYSYFAGTLPAIDPLLGIG
jgi:hypothetical protein